MLWANYYLPDLRSQPTGGIDCQCVQCGVELSITCGGAGVELTCGGAGVDLDTNVDWGGAGGVAYVDPALQAAMPYFGPMVTVSMCTTLHCAAVLLSNGACFPVHYSPLCCNGDCFSAHYSPLCCIRARLQFVATKQSLFLFN